jgi:gluconate 2-dehydrogenase alpha chain
MVLAEAGWDVLILEKGPSYFGDLTQPMPATLFANDELKSARRPFERPDPAAFPRTYRRSPNDARPLHVGAVNNLPENAGGGTVHWDAKTPRLWDIDFQKRSMLGPIAGADVQDWPFDYGEIAPFYDEIETLIGVQGDVAQLPVAPTLAHAPRSGPLPMPPGAAQYSSLLLSDGAQRLGYHPYPTPMAINSVEYDGRPRCNNCGFCSGYGCSIHARVGALAPLRRALVAGAELKTSAFVFRVNQSGGRATGVSYLGEPGGVAVTEAADLVVLAASAVETARLALLSGIPNGNGLIGRYLMFHWFTAGFGVYFDRRLHGYRGRSTTHDMDDFADPDFPGARAAAAASGLPYVRGGVLELGGSQGPIEEGLTYQTILGVLAPRKPFGRAFKQLMRGSPLRDRLNGVEMIGEDLAQAQNAVDLDPSVVDIYGYPVARITYSPHLHELAAQKFYIPLIAGLIRASGASLAGAVSETSTDTTAGVDRVPGGSHLMGGMRMGADPATSVCDVNGRVHALDNVLVADGSVFVTSGAHNPTLTIMAVALRNARYFA